MHGRNTLYVSGPVANEKGGNNYPATYQETRSVSESEFAHVVCDPVCNRAANVANGVRPLSGVLALSGVLEYQAFERVRVDLG